MLNNPLQVMLKEVTAVLGTPLLERHFGNIGIGQACVQGMQPS